MSFSDRKELLVSAEVFSHKYGIIGKIDVHNQKTKVLIERKRKVKKIYLGQKFQLYAEKLCLEEAGFAVAVSIALFAYTNEMEGAGKSKDIKRFFILFLVLTIFFGIMSYKP